MELKDVKVLLSQVTTISEKYAEIERITGESFNIFSILNLTTNEVRMHSALLGDLLNFKGSHGCGGTFLSLFIEQQKSKHTVSEIFGRIDNFEVDNSVALVEHHVGFKNADSTEGGRIDILVKDSRANHLIIENKVYAGDQEKQLIRYNNFDRRAPIFYLTLNGDEPSALSCGQLEKHSDYVCMSYKDDIVKWLEACVKETANKPLIRETLNQYINLIKNLTNQTTNNKMSQELKELMVKSPENLKAMFEIHEIHRTVRQSVIERFAEMLKRAYDERKVGGFEMQYSKGEFGLADYYLWIESLDHNHVVNLYFAHDLWNPTIGISDKTEKHTLDNEIIQAMSHFKLGKFEKWGGGWVWVNRYDVLNNYFLDVNKWSEIADGKMELLDTVLNTMIEFITIIIEVEARNR